MRPDGSARKKEEDDQNESVIDVLKAATGSDPEITVISKRTHDNLKEAPHLVEDENVSFYLLAACVPHKEEKGHHHTASNTGSLVLLVKTKDFEAVLQGDGTRITEKAILRKYRKV